MATNYTSLLGLAQPTTGELSGTWGDVVNNYITTYLDAAVADAQVIGGTNTTITLSKTTGTALTQVGTGTTGSSQYQILRLNGTPAGAVTVLAPNAYKTYIVINTCGQTATIKGVTGPTTGVAVATGEYAVVSWNGADFVIASTTNMASAGLTGTLPVARGGTGAATLTANNVLLGNGTSALQVVAPSTSGNVLTSNGTTWTSSAPYPGIRASTFTSGSGTFTIPTGITALKITVVGGGGSGANGSASTGCGGGGGTAITYLTGLTPGNTISYSVGSGGAGNSASTAGASGGSSSISSGTQTITTVTCTGGGGGVVSTPFRSTAGTATNGTLNIGGSRGSGQIGGGTLYGFGGIPTSAGIAGEAGIGYGSGGASSLNSCVGVLSGAGASGVIIFEW